MSILSALIGPATDLAGKFIQDKDAAAKMAHELATLADKQAQQAMLAQIEVTKPRQPETGSKRRGARFAAMCAFWGWR